MIRILRQADGLNLSKSCVCHRLAPNLAHLYDKSTIVDIPLGGLPSIFSRHSACSNLITVKKILLYKLIHEMNGSDFRGSELTC
jgi:hypothetical protein